MNRERLLTAGKILAIVASIYFFIVGIGEMGHAFKLFGREFSENVLRTTSSPVIGLFIGILATAIVQSSSTTTSIIVGLVAGGAVSIEGAIPMVMGANIGTTITNALVSLGHLTRTLEFRRAFAAAIVHDFFNIIAVLVLLPIELMTGFLARSASLLADLFEDVGGMKLADPLKIITKPTIEAIAGLLGNHPVLVLVVSVLLTFGMLYSIVKLLRSMVLERVETFFDEHLFRNAGRAMVFGILLTAAVQSSSITTSLIVPLAGAGILRITQIFPYTLGANIGTTLTAIFAALSTGNKAAISVSFAHLLFNLVGIGLIWPVPKIRRIPVVLAEGLAELSMRNRLIPICFIPVIFFLIPFLLIALFR